VEAVGCASGVPACAEGVAACIRLARMQRVMAVSFVANGPLHYLDPGEGDYAVGDWVLHPTDSGPEVARCVWAPENIDDTGLVDLPRSAGHATNRDLERDTRNRAVRAEAEVVAKHLIAEHQLPMKVVGIDYVDTSDDFDHQVVVYFNAPGRVDFRGLLGDLARSLRARIDLRQVGDRDAARLIGGIGSCGRELCCATFMTEFEPISMRLAKLQNRPANPLQISGACGRLMCCLKYEQPLYLDFERTAPAVGERVTSPAGTGVVVGHSAPGQSVTVRTDDGEVARCPLESVCATSRARKERSGRLKRRTKASHD